MSGPALGLIHGQMIDRIEALQRGVATLTTAALCDKLGDLRHFARCYGFDAVDGLAGLLESVMSYNGHRQIALTYFSLMQDAARSAPTTPDSARVYMAAAALRGCR